MNVRFVLLFVFLLVASILVNAESAFSSESGIPESSVPEFTVKFVKDSYAVTTTNLYTGVDETERISNNSIEVKIENQPFNNSTKPIYYKVRVKPHFGDEWTETHENTRQSDSSYTIITFPVRLTHVFTESGFVVSNSCYIEEWEEDDYSTFLRSIPKDGELDFQVKAMTTYTTEVWVADHWMFPEMGGHYESRTSFGSISNWSETQTLKISDFYSTTNSETPEQQNADFEPQQPNQLTLVFARALILIPIAAGIGLLIHLSKRKQ